MLARPQQTAYSLVSIIIYLVRCALDFVPFYSPNSCQLGMDGYSRMDQFMKAAPEFFYGRV